VRIGHSAEPLGFGRNFARTILRCQGDFVFPCDQDDRWMPDKLERCLAVLTAAERPVLLSHDAELADAGLTPAGLTLGGQVAALGSGNIVFGCCLAFDARFADFLTADHAWPHDTWLFEIADLLAARIALPEVLLTYRRHGANATAVPEASLAPAHRSDRWRQRWAQLQGGSVAREVAGALARREAMHAALVRNAGALAPAFGPPAYAVAIERLDGIIDRLRRRAALYGRPRWLRPFAVGRFAAAGGYRDATIVGALRDLIA
jgi:hypothetical protein